MMGHLASVIRADQQRFKQSSNSRCQHVVDEANKQRTGPVGMPAVSPNRAVEIPRQRTSITLADTSTQTETRAVRAFTRKSP